MQKTEIEWCDYVWNPVTGCSKISPGCQNCYAERYARRFWKNRKFTDVRCSVDELSKGIRIKKPSIIFVNSMSDLFHKDVPFDFIAYVWDEMLCHPQHRFLVLTKRPSRMLAFAQWYGPDLIAEIGNVIPGVSVENQPTADQRIPLLLDMPAAQRFISVEPMLEAIDIGMNIATCTCCEHPPSRWINLKQKVTSDIPFLYPDVYAQPGTYRAVSNMHGALSLNTRGGRLGVKPAEFEALPRLDWVICGGESGRDARPMKPEWVRNLHDQCRLAGIPFFFKQWGEWLPLGQKTEKPFSWPAIPNFWVCDDDTQFIRSGKKKAGHLLDGEEWLQMPELLKQVRVPA